MKRHFSDIESNPESNNEFQVKESSESSVDFVDGIDKADNSEQKNEQEDTNKAFSRHSHFVPSEKAAKGFAMMGILSGLLGGAYEARTTPNTGELFDDKPGISSEVHVDEVSGSSLHLILGEKGIEIKSDNERSTFENSLIDAGQMIESMGSSDDEALTSPEEKSEDEEEEMEASTAINNGATTSDDFD